MKVATIVGARPQFIKCGTVSREIRKSDTEILIHTGQHYDEKMSDVFFRELQIPSPEYHLNIGSGSHGRQTGQMLEKIEEILLREQPNWCLVYGDTNSTLAGALAAAKLHIPIAHVEAGLRSYNRRMPEEINRVMADHLATLLFCPTPFGIECLRKEGITEGVHLVGDVMLDAFLMYSDIAKKESTILDKMGVSPKEFILVTVHRAENTDVLERLSSIFEALKRLAGAGEKLIYPVHPRLRDRITQLIDVSEYPSLRLIDPVSYMDMLMLESSARCVLTDSGGVQKEAMWAGTPCVTLRDETEWIETVEFGWNTVVGTDTEKIISVTKNAKPGRTENVPQPTTGAASRMIVECLRKGTLIGVRSIG